MNSLFAAGDCRGAGAVVVHVEPPASLSLPHPCLLRVDRGWSAVAMERGGGVEVRY